MPKCTRGYCAVTVKESTYKRLKEIMEELNLRSFNAAIEVLIKFYELCNPTKPRQDEHRQEIHVDEYGYNYTV